MKCSNTIDLDDTPWPAAGVPATVWEHNPNQRMGMLADNAKSPCTTEGIIEALGKLLDPNTWDDAISETRRSVCANYYGGIGRSYDCLITTFPSTDSVCRVFVAYMNLAYQRRIPEYKPGAHPTTGNGSPYWPAPDGAVAITAVSRLTGVEDKLVAEILYELYWGTKAARITDGRFIAPYTFRMNKETLTQTPENSGADEHKSMFDLGLTDLIRWGVILGVVGVGAFAVTAIVVAPNVARTAMGGSSR
jgi:hypothetical protein